MGFKEERSTLTPQGPRSQDTGTGVLGKAASGGGRVGGTAALLDPHQNGPCALLTATATPRDSSRLHFPVCSLVMCSVTLMGPAWDSRPRRATLPSGVVDTSV